MVDRLATSLMPTMLAKSDEVIQSMIDINAEAQQVYIASRQLMLLIRHSFNLDKFFRGGQGATAAASRLESDAKLFGEVEEGMLNENRNRRPECTNEKSRQLYFLTALSCVNKTFPFVFVVNATPTRDIRNDD